jgi:diguanylate cyclase (GGDEF)-like protein/PAS domain S-box-containing protein
MKNPHEFQLSVDILKQLMDSSPAAMFIVDKKRNMLFANQGYADMFGYTKEEILFVNSRIFHISDEYYERFGKITFDAFKEGKSVDIDYPAKKRDGSVIWVHVVGNVVQEDGLILWTMFDITERVEAQKRLEEMNYNFEQYLKAIDELDIGIFVVNDDYKIRYMNHTMQEWFGDQTGKTCYSSVVKLNKPCDYCKIREVLHSHKKVTYESRRPDGRAFNIVATSIKNSDGSYSKMEVIRNVTHEKEVEKQLQEQQEKLLYQAYYDPLTGLANRVLFYDRLEHSLEKAERECHKLALLFIDLDRFKEINDSLGHDVGDIVLKIAAQRLGSVLREEDTLARLGGDEFTILLENIKSPQAVSSVAQKLLDALTEVMVVNGKELYISCSIGISIYPDNSCKTQDLLKYADSAMYKAKAEGRNGFQFYSSDMTELAFERVVMETSMHTALNNEDFVVYFQPQINLKTSQIVGIEALVRWQHETLGLIAPSKFISLAESTGLIVELDRFVMRSVMKILSQWHRDGIYDGKISLNLSVKQLQEQDFIAFLQASMQEYGCKAQWLEFEVIESQIMHNPTESIKILTQLHELGISLALDDFGTGYSSLAYLKKLPVNRVKIDQSFIYELPKNFEDASIVQAVIALSKSLKLDIVAEGVEREDQKNFLLENGCDIVQGYYYAQALPKQEMEIFLKDAIIS